MLDWGPAPSDLVSPAVHEALASIGHLEREWELQKLEKRIRQYFRNGAKGLEFKTKTWTQLIEEYADRVFSTLFQALSDRPWLAQADFLMVLDAGVKEQFPPSIIEGVPQHIFERTVLSAHDRAFEEQRFLPLLWEAICKYLEGPKTKRKANEALEEGRKKAIACTSHLSGNPLNNFLLAWVDGFVERLAKDTSGCPESAVPLPIAVHLFHDLIRAGSLPLPLMSEQGPPPRGWPLVEESLAKAYARWPNSAEWNAAAFAKGGNFLSKGQGMPLGTNDMLPLGKISTEPCSWNGSPPVATPDPNASMCRAEPCSWNGSLPVAVAAPDPKSWSGGSLVAAPDRWNSDSLAAPPDPKRQCVETTTVAVAPAASEAAVPPPPPPPARLPGNAPASRHPHCTQQEDCVGSSDVQLVRHLDGDELGDVYCTTCWTIFLQHDSTLQCVPY